MEAKHKQFIRRKLIPFILREHGRGFVMENWLEENQPVGEEYTYDEVTRKIPKCGTVACIGGSIEALMGRKIGAAALGITRPQARGLFYAWEPPFKQWNGTMSKLPKYGWPLSFRHRFARCTTAWGKARVAADLLREVIRTNGKCLEHADGH